MSLKLVFRILLNSAIELLQVCIQGACLLYTDNFRGFLFYLVHYIVKLARFIVTVRYITIIYEWFGRQYYFQALENLIPSHDTHIKCQTFFFRWDYWTRYNEIERVKILKTRLKLIMLKWFVLRMYKDANPSVVDDKR